MIKQELALSNEALCKARQEYYATIKKERQICDSLIEKARAQLVDMENDREKLKTIIQSLIKPEDVRANEEVTTAPF
jgi:regulator of sirC expression with transglutaminase-like and TPR domain